jgi:hypothetical protein
MKVKQIIDRNLTLEYGYSVTLMNLNHPLIFEVKKIDEFLEKEFES